jgi:hypothetical protein
MYKSQIAQLKCKGKLNRGNAWSEEEIKGGI